MELSFVIWNTKRKALYQEVCNLVFEQQADFLILIETDTESNQLVQQLSAKTGRQFYYQKNISKFKNGHLYSADPYNSIKTIYEHQRYCIKEIKTSTTLFNLCIVHLPSKNNWGNSADHDTMCIQLMDDIRFVEKTNKHRRSIIVGDFNMNPFEDGIINARGLHAVMNRDIAQTNSREIYGTSYDFFYNPMWSLMGDLGKAGLNGTHYHNTSTYISHFWNMYDQILVRPEMLDNFDDNDLSIVEKINGVSLTKIVKSTVRVDDNISDHLPIAFKLNF